MKKFDIKSLALLSMAAPLAACTPERDALMPTLRATGEPIPYPHELVK